MRRRIVLLVVAIAALCVPAGALAHPLGNFTTNRHAELVVSGDRIYALYVLDLAEIPTFQARGERRRLGKDGYAASLARQVRDGLAVAVGGERRALRVVDQGVAFPAGQGGLRTTRFETVLDAGPASGAVSVRDGVFSGRIGWREIVVRAENGARILSSTAPSRSSSERLHSYPESRVRAPLDVRSATFRVEPGGSAGAAPSFEHSASSAPERGREGGFASLVDREDAGAGVLLVSLALSLFWGAAHALTPGHGKAIVAAYLVGTKGRPRDALALGGIVTVTHTIGVFALGAVTLLLSEFIVPEDLYPWLTLVSSLLVVVVGIAVLRGRVLAALGRGGGHVDGHHPHSRDDHHHRHVDHEHGHGHSHVPAPGSGWRGLVAVGVSGGLLPCPTALVVLLAAISLHKVALGMVLIVAFSIGLAGVISGIGLLAIGARHVFRRASFDGPTVRALPAVSALLILGVGLAMTARAVPPLL